MLVRLEMDVDECISTYNELIAAVFSKKRHQKPFSILSRKVQAQFDSTELKTVIEAVITKRGLSATTLFNDGVDRGCRV